MKIKYLPGAEYRRAEVLRVRTRASQVYFRIEP
jgi:hypothetical protein